MEHNLTTKAQVGLETKLPQPLWGRGSEEVRYVLYLHLVLAADCDQCRLAAGGDTLIDLKRLHAEQLVHSASF